MKKLQKIFLSLILICMLSPLGEAAADVSVIDLQNTAAAIFPGESQLQQLPAYSPFALKQLTKVEGGISARYQARLLSDPWQEEALPTLDIFIYSYSTQAGAHAAFELMSGDKGPWLQEENRLTHVNGELMYQAQISFVSDANTLLQQAIAISKQNANVLFPPKNADFNLKSPSYSFSLTEGIPRNGVLSFDFYPENLTGAGSILSSAHMEKPVAGDFTLGMQSDGRLFLRFYSPSQKALCGEEAGWLKLISTDALVLHEWNRIEWTFGAPGLKLNLNGEPQWECASQQARSNKDITLGMGAIGFVHKIKGVAALTSSGQSWDAVLQARPFIDIDAQDPDSNIFQALKNAGIFTGSDGYVYPEQSLNRAEAVKILLQAYKVPVRTGAQSQLKDVPRSAWFSTYVAVAESIGLVQGTPEGLFLPGNRLNRAEFFTFLMRMEGAKRSGPSLWGDVADDAWFLGAANWAKETGLVQGDRFLAKKPVSRREAARAIYTLLYE